MVIVFVPESEGVGTAVTVLAKLVACLSDIVCMSDSSLPLVLLLSSKLSKFGSTHKNKLARRIMYTSSFKHSSEVVQDWRDRFLDTN